MVGLGTLLQAEVSTFSVVDEDKHSKKEDFYHTFEYMISPLGRTTGQVGKCQATRITRKWFVTAAHCVQDLCQNGCEIQLDLLENSPSVIARFSHTPKKPLVFVHPAYSPFIFAKNDFALLKLDIDRAPLIYYVRPSGTQKILHAISAAQFNALLQKNRSARIAFQQVRNPKLPPLLYFDEGNFVLDRKLSVIAIFDGKRNIHQSTKRIYYVKGLGYAYTDNFGIRKGMSGSGVMSNTGELVGMVAGHFSTWYLSSKSPKIENDYFMFPVFNKGLVDFMKDKMGSDFDKLYLKEANPYCVSKTSKNFTTLIQMVNTANKNSQKAANKDQKTSKKTGK